jgi:hypothetical protein
MIFGIGLDNTKLIETVMFWKNIGLAGGLFLLLSQGKDPKQKSAKNEKNELYKICVTV